MSADRLDEYIDSISRHFDLGEVVVTGTRTPKFLKDTPIQTRVITSREIEKTDATNIQDLLQQELPGVEFSYAMNQQTHLNFSGFGGQGVLFLIDGERLAGETMDDVDFTRLNMDNVERIEIVKGAASALYGSNATGGVINIITKKTDKPWTLNVNGRLARHNEQRYGASFGLNGKRLGNMFTANYTDVDNFDVHSAADPVTRIISTVYGDRTLNLKDQLVWSPSRNVEIGGRVGYFFRQTTRTAEQPERYRDFSGGLRIDWTLSDHDMLQANYAFDQYDKSDYQKLRKLDIRDYSNVRNTFRLLYNHTFGSGDILTAGADFMHDYLFNTNLDNTERKQDCFDFFMQYDWRISQKLEAVGAVRYDYFSDGGESRLTPKLNLCYKPVRNLSLRAGYGMGFRAPTLKEKYYDFDMAGIWIVEGNAALKSEISHNLNLSAEYVKGHYNLTASAYYNKVENKLATGAPYFRTPSDKLPYLPYTNLDGYSVYGGEIGVQTRWDNGMSARFTYAYTKEELPTDKQGNAVNNQYIPARRHSLNVRYDYDRQFSARYGISAGISGRLLSGTENEEYRNYYDVSQGTVRVSYPAYTMWKLSLVQRIGKAVKLTTALDNLFNYRPKYYYLNSPVTDGINFQIGLSIDIHEL
ncbi:TonB-dependent receptor [uncultured Prevotella sp.]|uniref:TonB-dependent receptor plug domain-containing protein n=1 Tax=uncultured Prevotella sp. TaxID=159272 RepID=UPI00261BA2F3|nr:TonB-dependent receptor [uncultured Prevotella sp.]